jgi:flagella basal body P-ring formation protein FlgA
MAITTAPTRSAFTAPPPAGESRAGGLRISSTTHQRRPWQIGLGVALVLVCAAVAGAVFQTSAKKVSILVAAKSLPAGTVLTTRDLATASIPASGDITAMAATGSAVVVGQQLDTPVYPGQVLVRQMLAATPQLASGEQVVGVLLKGDQMPSVALVAGDVVQVVAVPQVGQGSTIGGTIGNTLVPSATVFAVGPAPGNQTQYLASVSLEIPGSEAAQVTSYAAADQIGLSLVSEGTASVHTRSGGSR